ncbi:secretory protein [Apiospora kogelbergensis]|uniref:secretory protein n=1 Tax=Apiospora kogelbergensis TaxID=1337665 RepID=UPI00312D51E8
MFPHVTALVFILLAFLVARDNALLNGLLPDLDDLLPTLDLSLLQPAAADEAPISPSQDPFYATPTNISSYREGEIVRDRLLPNEIKSGPTTTYTAGRVYQYMYRSRDSTDNPAANVATLIVPPGPANNRTLLSFASAYDSPNPDCVPSYAIRPGSPAPFGALSVDAMQLSVALDRGWYVVTSDYMGINGAFPAGRQMGFAILDSVRGALSSRARSTTGLAADARWAQYGYSIGSFGSGLAAEMARSYAPPLSRGALVGSALGGTVPNGTSLFLQNAGGAGGGLLFSAFLGLSKAYANFSALFAAEAGPARRPTFVYVGDNDVEVNNRRGVGRDVFDYLQSGRAVLFDETFRTVTSGASQQGVHGAPDTPLYVFKGARDEISARADTELLVDVYCGANANTSVLYEVNTLAGHADEQLLGAPAASLRGRRRGDGGLCAARGVAVLHVSGGDPFVLRIGGGSRHGGQAWDSFCAG